jgi:hypothetical protein
MRVRAHVRLVAAVWLTCQVAAFAAAPLVLCNDHGVMTQMGDGHECGPNHHHHGQPEQTSTGHEHHQHTPGAPAQTTDATVDCRCTVSDAALAALTLDTGVLSGEFALQTRLVTAAVVLPEYAALTRSHHPDTPPPRA